MIDTKTGTSGETVIFTAKGGLAEYTTQTYSWKVEVTDSKNETISKTETGRICNEQGTEKKKCPWCNRHRYTLQNSWSLFGLERRSI